MLEVDYLQKLGAGDRGDIHRFLVTLRLFDQSYRGMLDILASPDGGVERLAPGTLMLNHCDYTIPATNSAANQLRRILAANETADSVTRTS